MGKLPNYVQHFGSNIVEGVAESWVETEMSWVEVDGAGWRWVHGLVIPIIKNGNDFINKLRLSRRMYNPTLYAQRIKGINLRKTVYINVYLHVNLTLLKVKTENKYN